MHYHNELLQEMKGLINRAKKRNASGKGKKRGGKTMPIADLPAFPGLQALEHRLLLSGNEFGHSQAEHVFQGINLSVGDGGVISVLDNADDDATASIDLGSDTFTFYGTQYTGANQLFVSDNGLITFGSGNTSSSNNLASGITQAAIAPMWDDWTTADNENDQVLAKVEDVNGDGINDRLIIEWSDVVRPNGGGAVTFQAILRLNTGSNEGDIVFNYVDSTTGTAFANGGGATVGIKDADSAEDGPDAAIISHNTGDAELLGDGQALRVANTELDTTAPTVEITDISPDPRNSAVSTVTFTFDGPVVGFDLADLTLTHNGGEENLLTGSETLESNDGGTTWTLSGIAGLTGGDGGYALTLNPQGSQIVDSQLNAIEEGDSDAWTVDTVAPTVAITAVTPDPISGSVDEITITFSKPIVGGFTAADLTLTRDGGNNLLDGNETLQTTDGGTTWILGNLSGFTGTDGAYVLTLTANASGIVDNAGNEVEGNGTEAFTVDTVAPDAPTIDLIADDDTGEENDDNETTVTLPTVTGTAEANAEIEVFVGGVSAGTTDADQNGDWTFTFTTELAEENNTITAKATDAAGNESDASAGLVIHIDTITPNTPGTPTLADASNSGSTEDTITSDTTPTIEGLAEATSFIAIFNGETLVGSGQANGGGEYSITLSEALSDGVHTLRIVAIDLAGNPSELSEGLQLTIDTEAPVAPSSPDLDGESDSGASSTDNITNNVNPTVGGTATAGTFVQVYVDGVEDGNLIFAEDGTWSHTIVNALAEGQRTITAKAFDLAANESQASGGLTVTVDVTAPTANIVDITPDPRNKVVNSIAITFSEAVSGFDTGDLDLRLDDGGNRIDEGQSLTTGNNTNFTLTGTGPITSGQGTFTLTLGADGAAIVDVAGNSLEVDATDQWDTDTVVPTIAITAVTPDPTNAAVASITFVASEEIANFSIEDLALTLDGGDNLLTGAQELTTNDNITFTLSNLAGITAANGQYTLSLVAIGSGIEDNSGNPLEEDATESFEVDTIAPDAPIDMAIDEESLTGSSSTRTSDTTPIIIGTAEPLSEIEVFVDGVSNGTTTADIDGTWSYQIVGELAEGARTITATATDDADNTSNESADFVITIDLTAPNAPTSPDLSGDSDSGDNSTDDRTNDTTPTFDGLAETGSLVTIFANGEIIGTGTAADGTYSITSEVTLEQGSYNITVTATDGAGNVSDASEPLSIVIDTQNDAQAVNGDTFTNDDTPTVNGISEEEATIEIFIDGQSDGTTNANGQGEWTYQLPELADGTYAITMRSTDKAGNVSELSEPFSLTVDTVAPDAPTALDLVTESDSGSDDEDNLTKTALATITGSAEAFSTVEIFVEGQSVGFAEFDVEDGTTWSFTFGEGDLASGLNNVTAKATDRADNESVASTTLEITLDTSAPAAPSTPNLADASDSNIDSDNNTSDSTPTFTGTAEANSIVKIFANGVEVGSGTATGGNYEITISSLEDGTYPITATATDAAGNVSELSGSLNVTIDTNAPAAPTVTGDAFTSDTTPTVSGTADEDVLFVQVYVNGVANGNQVAVDNGTWTHNIEGPLDEGAYEITVTGFDLAGNESDSSVVFDLVVDTTAPDGPAALDLAAGSDSGTSSTDNETNTTLATITGTTEANSTVEVFVGGVSVGPATVEGTNWSYTFSEGELSEGLNEVSAKATDRAGNESVASADLVIDLDTTSPSAPSTPDLAAGSDTGFVDADNNTNDNTPTFTGTAEADSIVKIFSAGVQVGSGTATGGNYSITVSTLADGTSQITATATDAAGNVSTLSSGLTVTIDTSAPSAPTVTGDNNTNDTTPTVSGTAEANSRVEVFIDGVSDGTVTTNGSGAWTKNLTNHVAGTYAITAKATDPAGNESAASTTFNLTIDTVAPNAPLIDLEAASDTGSSDSDNETSTALATITGTTEEGSTVEVFVGGNSVGAASVDGTTWSYTFTESELSEGNNTVTAKATDEAGNVSVASANLVIDLDTTDPAAPSTPDLDAGSDSDINTDDITTDTTPTFTGTAEAGSTVKIFADGVEVGSGTATGGNYSITISELEDGLYDITATATDAAGNVSDISAGLEDVIIDTTAPSVPEFTFDTNTNDTTPTITGTGEVGTYVQVYVDGVENGDEILIGESGTWEHIIEGPLAEGTFAITVEGIDEAGNSSGQSDAVNVTIDLTAPDAPELLALHPTDENDTGLLEDSLTSVTSPVITGTAPLGTTVQLYVEGVANGDPIAVDENGIWFATVVGELAEGDNTITATAFDEAGNESASSAALVVTIDTIAPDAPGTPDLIDASDSGSSDNDDTTNDTTPTFTGTGVNGTVVTLFANGTAIGSDLVEDGTYTITAIEALEDGAYDITAKAMDEAGNLSVASAALSVVIDTTPTTTPTIDGDNNTNDTTPTVGGDAPLGATLVQVYVDGVANGNPVAVIEGTWTHDIVGPLAEGEFEVTATAFDAAGNESNPSALFNLTIDLTAPAAPSNIELDGGSTNGINDSFTNTTTPTIVGDFEEGTVSVEVFIDGDSVGFAGLGEGTWSFNFEEGLEEGSYTITAKATDEAGNESDASEAFVFTVDVTDPATPSAPDLEADSDSNITTDNITSDNTPTFTGTIEANGRATIFVNGEAVGGHNTNGTGVYDITVPQLEDGTYLITVVAMDQAGNLSETSQSLSVTIDTAAPAAPTVTGDVDTSDTTPTVSGTAEAGSTVEVFIDGVSDGTVTADGEGNWTKTLSQQVEGDALITATATDTAGNESEVSSTLTIDIDTTAPDAPTAPDLSSETDSGESSTDNLSNADTVVLTGTAEAGSTVTLFSNGEQIDQTTADGEGNYDFEIPVGAENSLTVTFTVTATDAAGNESDASDGLVYVRDVDAPTVEVTPITPDPRETAVDSMTITFSEEVFNLTLADLSLTRNGGDNLLTDAQTLTTEDGITWTLTGLTSLTGTGGVYTLTVLSDAVNDEAGNTVAEDGIESWTFNTAPPTLTTVSNLTGAIKNTAFTITYEDLAAAANEADVDGGEILFKIAAVSTGTLTKDGNPVVPGTTTLAEGEELVWTPANNATGTLNAFTIRANDNFDDSATAVQVKVVVEKPTVSLTVLDDEASEADLDTATFQVERNGSTDAALVVNYSITGIAKNGTDLVKLSGTVTIEAGESTALITVTPINDAIFEADETVILTLKTSSNYTVDGEASTATAIIEDNEPTVSIEATDDEATEAGLSAGTFTVTLSEPADQDITVFYTVTGTATSNTDYIKLTGSVLIAAGDTTATITVTPKQDAKVENDETITVTLKTNAAYGIDSENNADTVTLEDDEPTVSIEATDDEAGEQGLATGTFTITLSNAVDQDTKVFFKVTGTAKNGTDYTKIDAFVIIAAGDTSATITITPTQDTTAEADETVTLTLTSKTTYRVDDEDSAATVTIEDNEPTVSIEATDDEASEEGLDTGTFTVTRDGPDNSQVLRVFYTVTGTAKSSSDFVKLTGFVDIAAGEDTATITVTPTQNATFEPNETVIVTLTNKTTYNVDADNATATVTIADNEPVVSVEATDDTATETGLTTGAFTFTRTGSTAAALTVFFSVGGTARSSDFNSLFSSIVIPAGESSVVLNLTPKADTNNSEGDETVIVTLKTSSSYGIDGDNNAATIIIEDINV